MFQTLKELNIKFEPQLETQFRKDYIEWSLRSFRGSLIIASIVYALLALVDFAVLPISWPKTILIRFALVLPMLLLILKLSYTDFFRRHMQLMVSMTLIFAGLAVIAFFGLAQEQEPAFTAYHSGLFLLIFWIYSLAHLEVRYATATGSFIMLAYLLTTLIVQDILNGPFRSIFLINAMLLLCANLIGIYICYEIERAVRQEFKSRRTIAKEMSERKRLTEELRVLSELDGLTGIANRRIFDDTLEREWLRAKRGQTPLALIMIDVDHFKNYNDSYGHQAGDECLKMVSKEIQRLAKRSNDLAARYGGEEFAVILHDTGINAAHNLAQRLCREVEKLKIPHATSPVAPQVTISAGAASLTPQEGDQLQSLIEAADHSLYEAKRAGRNRAC